ncbi:hypothetical protein SAMN05661010_00818 [Modicisalibacter muralis]|uniref:Uncharacterized protein n=1 Tax=Modicisalibacter muralis TaxID=119000 RepID=A0A1G9GT13_9GAMM|nr:hypothetical protein [Halomonas muralis]SDL03675.1 hypothetical protein SAMN05661010_00818 [Halomonas muralis]
MLARQPVAYTPKYHEKALVTANRFLGLPNELWSVWAALMIGMTGWFASGVALIVFIVDYGLWLLLAALSIWLVLRCLTPSRSLLKRVALEEHRIEVEHVATLHGVSTHDVLLVDSEAERQLLELGQVAPSNEDSCPIG